MTGVETIARIRFEHFQNCKGIKRIARELGIAQACDDEGTKKTLHHLLTREITHANMFMKALDAMGKLDDPFFGNIPPDETVKLVFNLSQDEDAQGPWNKEPEFDYVADPRPEGGMPLPPINADDEGRNAPAPRMRKRQR